MDEEKTKKGLGSYIYILKGKIPVPCGAEEAVRWMGNFSNRLVARTELGPEVFVSTVFLVFDHSFVGDIPVLFETMIFGIPELSDYQERYTNWEDAEEGHKTAVEIAKQAMGF